MVKKAWLLLSVIVSITVLLNGCKSTKVFYYSSNVGNEIEATYKYFKGTETKKIDLKKDEILKLEYDSVVETGTLTINLLDPNKQKVTQFEANQSGSYKFVAETPGRYQLSITGDGTEGSFHFSWEIDRSEG